MTGFALHDKAVDRDRLISGLAVVAVHAALGWALLAGLGVKPGRLIEAPLEVFDLAAPKPVPPPPPPVEKPKAMPERSGRASPPNLKSKATQVAAPVPEIVLPVPPVIVTAPTPAAGNEATSGNSDRVGPGTGSGGIGDGTGSGGWGDGPGGGGGGGIGRDAYPVNRDLGQIGCATRGEACPSVEITVRFTVGVDGRVSNCRVLEPSGDAIVDRETCPRAERRLRFRPALDRAGRRTPASIVWTHEFIRELTIEEDDDK